MSETINPTPDKLIGRGRVIEMTGLSRSTIARRQAAGMFPAIVKIGGRALFSLREVLEWVAEAKAGRADDPWSRRREDRVRQAELDEQARVAHQLIVKQLDDLAHAPRQAKPRRPYGLGIPVGCLEAGPSIAKD